MNIADLNITWLVKLIVQRPFPPRDASRLTHLQWDKPFPINRFALTQGLHVYTN